MVICRARGDWIPSLKWPPNSSTFSTPRWAPTVTWSYLDALHRNVGEISEFLLNVGVDFTKKIDVRKGWVMARLGFVSLVWCCMNLYDLYGSFEIDAIWRDISHCKIVCFCLKLIAFFQWTRGSFSAFTLRIPSPSFLVALSGSGSVSLWRCPKRPEQKVLSGSMRTMLIDKTKRMDRDQLVEGDDIMNRTSILKYEEITVKLP